MPTQYFCKNQKRREAVRLTLGLNGIDYLEVMDHLAPAGSPRQRTLLLHCLHAVPALDWTNVQILGGVRITPVNVLWAHAAPAIPEALVSPQEQAFFTGLPQADHVLVIRTASAGDFSIYTLNLVASPKDPGPPLGFDPRLSSVDFSFKVECPSPFDCETTRVCPPQASTAPLINYLAKDYSSFRRLMLDRLAVSMPDWQEQHAADMGIALIETLAYAADHLSYYQDAVATEAYLGTARKRVSIRRHARLLDYAMHDGCNARAWVFFEIQEAGGADGLTLKAGAQLLTQWTAPTGALDPTEAPAASAAGSLSFETLEDVTLHSGHNEIVFYTWSDEQCCLPRGATQATLADNGSIKLSPGDLLLFEEKLGPGTGVLADAHPSHRHVVRLTSVTPGKDPLGNVPVIEITWDAADALAFPLCLSAVVTSGAAPHTFWDVSVARGNVTLAHHALAVANEVLATDPGPQYGPYRPHLAQPGLSFHAPYDLSQIRKQPAAAVILQDPRAAFADVVLQGHGETWTARRDLLGSAPSAHDFVVETEEDGTAYLRFGDGLLGAVPVDPAALKATYRTGNGGAGNVGAGAIAYVVSSTKGFVSVRNPLAATGGTDPENIQQVRLFAPQAFRTQERAVTEADYADVAERHPEVRSARATLRWTGSWHTMFVTIDRSGGKPLDAAFRAEISGFLDQFRLAAYDIEVSPPIYVPLDIAFTVCVAPGYFQSDVAGVLFDVFSDRVLSDGRLGFFHPDNFTFGRPVYLSQVVATAMQVPGVLWVDTNDIPPKPNRFKRWGQASRGETAAGRIKLERLEIARLSNDPNQPENGKIEFYTEGGL
jgi:hypothetical protein